MGENVQHNEVPAHRVLRWICGIPLSVIVMLTVLAGCGTRAESTDEPVASVKQAATAPDPKASATHVVWVLMKQRAMLTQAQSVRGWAARGQAVQTELSRVAATSQASIVSFLSARGVKYKPFWIVNALRVEADQSTIDALSVRSDVQLVVPDRVYSIPPIVKGTPVPRVNTTEWGLDNIRAPEVWATFGVKGEGVVVANIDTGVQFDHPALRNQYRGNTGGGTYDHNYNWFDPAQICGIPSTAPCDNAGHGTHTMGTMVGDDGDPGDNQVGVAPHARWMAAKGCEDFSCSTGSLLAAAQWVLAPTDLNGNNPRPDLRPQIVNNSWGAPFSDPFFQASVQSWVAAGMFPSFSAGNSGPGCGSVGSPGDYPEAYAAGAYDQSNFIAFFSSRGPSSFGVNKPNLAAPGVNVRSSVPGDKYDFFSGTSMAAPHLSGTVALMWAAAPSLLGDVASTRALLDQTAVDTSDLSCGGTPENNAVFGEGRLDAFAAVDAAPRGPTGILAGTVTAALDGIPLPGVAVTAHSSADGRDRATRTAADGTYKLTLPVGSYVVSTQLFAYVPGNVTADVTDGATTTANFALALAPSFPLSGTVRDANGAPLAGAKVTVVGTPLAPAMTDASGHYAFASVPAGIYSVSASLGRCYADDLESVAIDAAATLDLTLPRRTDAYGYSCSPAAFAYVSANNVIATFGDENSFPVTLPFPFSYYGKTYTTANVAVNGVLHFLNDGAFGFNTPIPDPGIPNAAIYAFWDDLFLDGTSSIRTDVVGTAPNRQFVVEWRDATSFSNFGVRLSFEIILSETGQIVLQYASSGSDVQRGASATIGLENEAGMVGLQYSFNEPAVDAGTAIFFTLPPSGFVRGKVTDVNDGLPVNGALVRALSGSNQIRETKTDSLGNYQLQVPVGAYVVEASRTNYGSRQATVTVGENQFVSQDFALSTARASLSPATVQVVLAANQTRVRALQLTNTGTLPLDWSIAETGGKKQTVVATARVPRSTSADPNARDTRALFGGSSPPRGWTPDAAGDILSSFTPAGMSLAWGVGYTANVWLSDVFALRNVEFQTSGTPTGRAWPTQFGAQWEGDMAYDSSRNLVCQVNVGGDNGIYCWDPSSGSVVGKIAGSFLWTSNSQRGLAYRADDDSFYIGGWNMGTVFHVKGLSYSDPGTVLGSCMPADGSIAGLAYNASMNVLWASTNSTTDTIYELNPDDCTVLSTLPHPTPGFNGAGLEMDELGNLWTIGQNPNKAYLMDSGVPAFTDVPWLSTSPSSGTVAPGAKQQLNVTVNSTGLSPGIYLASLFVRSNSGREGNIRVPVSVVVSAYQQGIDVGGAKYTDTLGDPWAADKAYKTGSWGYVQKGSVVTTTKAISGTSDPTLFQSQREDPYAYRFDSVPNGIYQIEMKFAELGNTKIGKRLFDVIAENTLLLPAHDIVYEVKTFAADNHTFFVEVTDNQMDLRFVPRQGFMKPVVNAVRITHRPDR